MKKAFLLFAVGLFFIGATKAQTYERPIGSEFSIGISPALPVGDFNKTSSFGLGADLKYAYNFDETIAATVSAGYNNFFVKKDLKDLGFESNVGFVPIKAGVRFSMGNLYAEPQIGAAIGTSEGSETKLTYAGQIGVMASPNFDVSLRYEGISAGKKLNGDNATLGFVALRLAYTLPH